MNKQELIQLLNTLTLDDKITMIHGASMFQTGAVAEKNVPAFTFDDGPMGPRKEYQRDAWIPIGGNDDATSYLPSNSALAATFNRKRALESGTVLGREARGRGKDMILAPGINIHRSPLGGRNFEYMSEDPYLTAEIAVPFVEGIQQNDVSACVKHYALNNQETDRTGYNADVSERALWEIYLPAFRATVKKAHTMGMMGSYNRFHEEYLCHSQEMIDGILRQEWGFDGIYVSDWNAIKDTVKAGNCEIDIDMNVTDDFDNYKMAQPLKKAVLNGQVQEAELDKKVMHILHVMNELHMLDGKRQKGSYNDPSHPGKLLQTAEESMILLKNEKKLLPLNPEKLKKVVVIGDNADRTHAAGGGSAEIKALYEITPLMGIKMFLGGNCEVVYEPGYYACVTGNAWNDITAQNCMLPVNDSIFGPRQDRLVKKEEIAALNKSYEERAIAACKDADAVIYVGGLNHDFDVEDRDRSDYHLPYGQDALIKKLLAVRPDMIVTMVAGSPFSMTEWIDQTDTLLLSYYAGMETGRAFANLLFGEVSPSGKLPTTYPKELSDSPAHSIGQFGTSTDVSYAEDVYVGYRYFDTYQVKPQFAFGHGLSYATFTYSDLQVTAHPQEATDQLQSSDALPALYTVKLAVSNDSDIDAMESVQLYIAAKDSKVKRPVKELRGFDKKEIAAHAKADYTFALTAEAFSYYDIEKHCYIAPAGTYEILLGSASDDIRLSRTVTLSADIMISRS